MAFRLRVSVVALLGSCAGSVPAGPEPARGPQAQAARPLQVAATLNGAALADAVGVALARACTPNALEDPAARTRCADALTQDPTLRAAMQQPHMRWGAQTPGAGYDLSKSNTTLFDPLVWRRLYLSTFAFSGGHRVVADGSRFVLHVPVQFRNALDAGEYPYPFWHSQAKWQSYERTRELLVFVERDAISAVLRSQEQDDARVHVERSWDGRWRWNGATGEEPRAALYSFLFSYDNPYVAPLEQAYRMFSERQRAAACESCHNPSNPSKINPLEFFNYPNQALSARHDIVEQLVQNRMPPPASPAAAAGIEDASYRHELLTLARSFADLGDRALAYERAH